MELRRHILLAILTCLAARSSAAFEIVVPAYFYPEAGSPWVTMTASAAAVDITAIMNPDNGPGAAPNAEYVAAVNAFRVAGGRLLGYVHSTYGNRPLTQVTADVDKYAAWYNVDGIFVDEMDNTLLPARETYYKSLYNHVKSKNAQWEVMGNPGINTAPEYLAWPAADRLVVFEDEAVQYFSYAPSAWNFAHPRQRFVHLLHTEHHGENLAAEVPLARDRNGGAVYVTNDVLDNPWDTLPSYWQSLVTSVAQIHQSYAAGDFNEDGQVNAADLATWSGGLGQRLGRSRRSNGDATDDGNVDGRDFLLWQRLAGSGPAAAAALQALPADGIATPEPPGSLMAILACGAAVCVVRCHAQLKPIR